MDMERMRKMMTENPDIGKKGMEEWGMWMKNHLADFADAGFPTGKNSEVSVSGAVEKSNDIGGYSILQAESKEAAAAMLKDNPHLKMPGATIDLAELMPMGESQ